MITPVFVSYDPMMCIIVKRHRFGGKALLKSVGLETKYCYIYRKAECVNLKTQNLQIFHLECFKYQVGVKLFILKILSHINSLNNEVNTVTK
jgi:hypothetical protein